VGAAPLRTAGVTSTEDGDGIAAPVEPVTSARRSPRRARWTWPLAIAVVLVVVWAFVAEPLRVTSVSMEPSLRAGQHVLVDKVSYRLHPPRRDDLIVFPQPGDGQLAVKRIVGIAGDTIALEDGVLVVNGVARREPYVEHRTIDSVYFGPEVVPGNAVFVMGDNRGSSIDSRSYGPVEVDTVIGRVMWHT
jgi:signal peptidase I